MPKAIFIILEQDMIEEIDEKNVPKAIQFFEEYIDNMTKYLQKILKRFDNMLPEHAKRSGWPRIIYIEPTAHRNYTEDETYLRRALGDVIQESTNDKQNVWSMKLLQVWDKNEVDLVKG